MKKIKLNYYIDPAHGWIKISLKKLQDLNIYNLISNYSYIRKEYAYLEEDLDANILTDALDQNNIAYEFNYHYANKYSKIRGYNHFLNYYKGA